jgi:REP element-mobilizing transposase RayT
MPQDDEYPMSHPQRPAPVSGSVGAIVGGLKSSVARRINALRGTPGASVWQRNYYEHIVRDEKDWARICHYIEMNPAVWADDPENR